MGNTKKLPVITLTPEVVEAINEELAYQSTLQGSGRADAVDHGTAGQIVTMNAYMVELNTAWTKTAGDEAALDNMRKIAATALRALIVYGCPRRKL